jgi:hypothetical protein
LAWLYFLRQFFSGSAATFLRLFPTSILDVILFLVGAQLALGSCDISKDKDERFVNGCLPVRWRFGTSVSRPSSE